MRRAGAVLLLALLLSTGVQPLGAASRVLPRLAFRVLRTPHFRIYYHQGLEQKARLLAQVAESVWAQVPARLGLPAPATTHVLLVDQDDASNGWATPLPYDTVMVTAAWPAPPDLIGNTSDWLRLVFTHEYTHVLQLHQSRGYARAIKAVFGRAPLAFPNLFLPGWSTEGLATFTESRFTGEGRLNGGDSFAIVADRVRLAGPERMDQVTGGQVEWPAGSGSYLYGGFFAEYLAKRFGEEKLGELGRRTAGRLPYFASGAYRGIFGESLGELWTDYQRTLGEEARAVESGFSRIRQLTRDGYWVSTPRFAEDGQALVYGRQNANDFPAVAVLTLERGTNEATARGRRLAIRYGGEQVSVRGGIVFFDRADYEVNVAWRSDLYAADLQTGRTQRLTRNARLVAPDISPDGRSLACIAVSTGGRRLEIHHVEGTQVGRLTLSPSPTELGDPGAIYGSPRWSPDGSRLAVERRRPGGPSEIVVVDVASRAFRVVATSASGRNITPAWLPDGRTLLFSSDREGRHFQIYATNVDSRNEWPVLAVPGGAQWPEVSADGRRLVYVGYTAHGYDLFEAEMRAGAAASAAPIGLPRPPVGEEPNDSTNRPIDKSTNQQINNSTIQQIDKSTNQQFDNSTNPPTATSPTSPYRPFFTLLPRSWQPAGDYSSNNLRLGVATGGIDLLGRHAFGVTALWRVQAGSDSMYGPHRARPDWSAFYVYDRWRPSLFVSASDETSFLPQSLGGVPQLDAELRERKIAFGVGVPFAGVRRSQVWQSALNVERDGLRTVRGDRTFVRNAIQSAWAFDSARQFGYSISPEHGITVSVTSEQVREGLGADGNADAFSGEVRGYARTGPGHAVLASRAAIGVGNGDANVARIFYLGGPQAGGLIDFGNEALSLLRGFEDKAFAGRHVGAANVEYRFPLWRIEHGKGNWPFFLRTVHAAVFADAGQVWDRSFSWTDVKASLGAELSLDTVLGFGAPLTISGGVARTFRDGHAYGTGAYLRFGAAF